MTYKELKLKIKEEQKELARLIRRGKNLRKPSNRIDLTDEDMHNFFYTYDGKIQHFNIYKIENFKKNYRYKHIAYCNMFNNTPYEKIEQPRESNKIDEARIRNIKIDWWSLLDEQVICNGS